MKKTYIQPEANLFAIQGTKYFMDNASIVGVEGLDDDISIGGEDEDGKDADTKEFVFEEDPWEGGSDGNYWE